MGPKKEVKKEAQKRDKAGDNERKWSIEGALNSDSWRCVVVMAVEKTHSDCFILEEFVGECQNGRRHEVSFIDFEKTVIKILNDFANGELPYKYTFLLNFSSVFQEAVDYMEKKMNIPVLVLVKVVKALLFYLREENLLLIQKKEAGPPNPITAMAERPANADSVNSKKKDLTKKGDNGLKVRPPSVTKEHTKLLKRGEKAKDDLCIDDAPPNAYFNLYVLLTGFYDPDFPLELIKANIPLHAILCVDTSQSSVTRESPSEHNKFQKFAYSETRPKEIQNFWDLFLKIIWDTKNFFYFKDTIFQVYVPQSLLCEKKKLAEFIYREISYLMYDLSDLKRQLDNYLDHFRLWNVAEKSFKISRFSRVDPLWPENFPEECMSASMVLRCILNAVCMDDRGSQQSVSSDGAELEGEYLHKYYSSSEFATFRSCADGLRWSHELEERGDFNLLNLYYKTKELDVKYDLDGKSVLSDSSEKLGEIDVIQATGNFQTQVCFQNIEETVLPPNGALRSYWTKYNKDETPIYEIDSCLYPLLMTRVLCQYRNIAEPCTADAAESFYSVKKNSTFELIKNLNSEMRKPHFTVTDGSRSIIRAAPYNVKNISRDFFCPEKFKVVSPEKLKASSAPEFRGSHNIKIQGLYTSETFPVEISKNPFENLEEFVSEGMFSNTNDFDFLEFLNKSKLLEREYEHWSSYNCVDHIYSLLNDCIFLRLHNRKDCHNVHHETFNVTLRTPVGLRDFYDYILEDEGEWLTGQDELYHAKAFLSNALIEADSFRNFTDADFWMPNSLKSLGMHETASYPVTAEEIKTRPSSEDGIGRMGRFSVKSGMDSFQHFDGYNASNVALQFSGLNTIYYSNDCSVAVQLIERLYGKQELGIHVTEASHTLHLHSYVCPEPHILDPFTFHISYKNGVIIAFSRRFVKAFEDIEQKDNSTITVKSKNDSREFSVRDIKNEVLKSIQDEDFVYDMAASLPNGLWIRTVRRIVEPCYIKQCHLAEAGETANLEMSRLFLPNGNIVRMMNDGTVLIFKVDASIISANLNDLTNGTETENLSFARYEVLSGEGHAYVFEEGEMTSSKRYQVLQNTDMSNNQVFFRRKDGTNYMLQGDGTLCVKFTDGTKISSSLLVQDEGTTPPAENGAGANEEDKNPQESDCSHDSDFVFVFTEITAEHPDYATVIHNSKTQKWRILLPQDSTISIEHNGHYFVDIDKQTELEVEADIIRMKNFSEWERELQCSFTANLTVFRNKEGGDVYCHMEGSSGKTFIVEGNSNCYILDDEKHPEARDLQEASSTAVEPKESDQSEFIASADLQVCPSTPTLKYNKLLRENKYFVLKRDVTGGEILHVDDVRKVLTKTQKGSLVFTQKIPGTEKRCFVLVIPTPKESIKKWEVPSILPDPKYEPGSSTKTVSSTYGVPPSWMHPFPKQKVKFVVPRPLTCRVFIETKKTELSPGIGTLDCYYCEINYTNEAKHSEIPPEGVEEYLRRLSNDDQDLLTEIYSLAASELINEKKKFKPTNSENLEHYLELSAYYVAMREYHARCIRFHIVPNYFHHPAGMCWLILNHLLLHNLRLSDERARRQSLLRKATETDESESMSGFSNEEIEYNFSVGREQSFSSLSYRSDISAQTAPPILRTGRVCRCKVKAVKNFASSPIVKCYLKSDASSESYFEEPHVGICEFQENDIQILGKGECAEREMPLMSLEDLMYLGLI